MNLYSTYNRVYLTYTYSRYINYTENGEFIMIPVNQVNFDFFLYLNIKKLFHHKKENVHFYYHNIENSIFYTSLQLKKLKKLYRNVQKFKIGFSKFMNIVYKKYKKKFNDTTLLYEPLPKNKIVIYENNCVYTFGDVELFKMVENCFNYDCYGVPIILKLKNPYTNIPFSFHNLIHIYFELMKYLKHSYYFGLYFKYNFNSTMLLQLYKPQIFVNCITKRYEYLTKDKKKKLLYEMITDYDDTYASFENVSYDMLENLFGNYVLYYYIYKRLKHNFTNRDYSSLCHMYERKFSRQLKLIYKKNPSFGRKIYHKTIGGKYIHYIDDTLF